MPSPEFSHKVKKNVAANFDQSLALYETFEGKHRFFARLAAHLADWIGLKAGASVLDVGCGNGISVRVLSEQFGCRVLGVDLSPQMIAAGRQALGDVAGVRLVVGDGEDLAGVVGDERFDAVVYNASIFIFPDAARAIRQAAACLKKSGVIAFSFYPLIVGPNAEDLFETAFSRLGLPFPKFRVITDYKTACRALEAHCGPVTHHQRVDPLDVAFLKDFFSIPAQSASLFPGMAYDDRRQNVCDLMDVLRDAAESGRVIWRMAASHKV
jgi:ubiquinone/menaquinone biosynthesis C-methylase UbiE